jgi:hypothetical protein
MAIQVSPQMRVAVASSEDCEMLPEMERSIMVNCGPESNIIAFTPTSRKKAYVSTQTSAENVAGTAHGRKYGYFFRN